MIKEETQLAEFDFESEEVGGNRLTRNSRIKGQDARQVCYSFERYAQEMFDLYTSGSMPRIIKKDLETGDIIAIRDVMGVTESTLNVELENGVAVEIPISKEKKFMELHGIDGAADFVERLKDEEGRKAFLSKGLSVCIYETEPYKASLWKAHTYSIKQEFQKEISKPSQAYVALVRETNKGGYIVEVQGIEAFMPGSLSAPNKLLNFGELVGEKVIVMIEDYIPEMDSFIVSHKKYIDYVLPDKIKELDLLATYRGTITGTSKYGIFLEFNEIFTGLLHTSKMNGDTHEKFKAREFRPGDEMEFFINEITKDNRLILTEKDPIEKMRKIEEFVEKSKTGTLESEVAAVMKFGIIVNVDDHSGLIPNREFRRKRLAVAKYQVGDKISVEFDNYSDGKITFKLPGNE